MSATAQTQVAHRHWILIAAMMAMFMAAIEVTIVATAMPTIIAELGGFSQFGWVFSIYLLTQAVSVPIYVQPYAGVRVRHSSDGGGTQLQPDAAVTRISGSCSADYFTQPA